MIRTPAFLPIRARLTSLQAVGFAIRVLLPPVKHSVCQQGPQGQVRMTTGHKDTKGQAPVPFSREL